MATRHPQAEGSIIYVKGAPEVLLQLSTLSDNQKVLGKHKRAISAKGQQVLGFAYKTVTSQQELTHETLSGLTFLDWRASSIRQKKVPFKPSKNLKKRYFRQNDYRRP